MVQWIWFVAISCACFSHNCPILICRVTVSPCPSCLTCCWKWGSSMERSCWRDGTSPSGRDQYESGLLCFGYHKVRRPFKHFKTSGCVFKIGRSLGLKFYKQPERGSVLKHIRNRMGSTLLELCVCSGSTCHCFAIPFVPWHHWESEQRERTNKHTFPLSFLSYSFTHKHLGSHRNVVLYCWGESPLRFTASPWNAGTSEYRSAKKRSGGVDWREGGKKTLSIRMTPYGTYWLFLRKQKRERQTTDGVFVSHSIFRGDFKILTWDFCLFSLGRFWTRTTSVQFRFQQNRNTDITPPNFPSKTLNWKR